MPPIRVPVKIESSGNFPAVEADQLGGVVTDVVVSGNTMSVTKKGETDKTDETTSDITLPSGGLDQDAVDLRVQEAKGTASPLYIGKVSNDGIYSTGGASVGSSSKWALEDHVHPLRDKEAEILNGIRGERWHSTDKIEFATTIENGDTVLQTTQNHPAVNVARTYSYTSSPPDVSPRETNEWATFRVEEVNADSSRLRVNYDVNGTAGPTPLYTILNQAEDANFLEVDRWTASDGKRWVAYAQFCADLPEGTQLGGEEYDPLELNLDRFSIDNILQEFHNTERLGTTTLGDGPGVGLFIPALNGGSRSTFTLFSPTFDGDDAANQHGIVIGRILLRLSGRSSLSTGFTDGNDQSHRFGGYVSYHDMENSSVFNSAAALTSAGLAGGVALDSVDYFDATTKSGEVTCYIAKNSNNQWGYYYEYIPETGYVGSGHTNVASNLDLFYEHSGASVAPTYAPAIETLLDYQVATAAGNATFAEVADAAAMRALTTADDAKTLVIDACLYLGASAPTGITRRDNWTVPITMPAIDWRTAQTSGSSITSGANWIMTGQVYGNSSAIAWNRCMVGKSANNKPNIAFNGNGGVIRIRFRLIG